MMFTFNSCDTYNYATTQDDVHIEYEEYAVRPSVSFDIVISNGTPYYMNGRLLYYMYEGLYYYPYYYNNYLYVRTYNRPFKHIHSRPYFRPHKYDYKFRHDQYRRFYPHKPYIHERPLYNHNRPNINHRHYKNGNSNMNRFGHQNRTNNRKFGGRR